MPSKGKAIVLMLLMMVLLLMAWTFYGLERSFEPVISKVAEIRAKQLAVETINRVITEKIVDNAEYQTLMVIHKDDQNRPVLIQPNLIKIEKLQATALLEINQALKNLSSQEFSIPLGVVSGSKLLANQGPDINVSVKPMGTVDIEMVSEFKQAGINQTRHVLSLKVNTEIMVVVPFVSCQTKVVSIVPVADNIIIGPVPSIMMNLDPLTQRLK